MKRKLLALLTAVLLLSAVVLPAFADVIWEPENSFYNRHADECTYHDRSYLANGGDGYVTVRTAPSTYSEVANVANGTRFFVQFLWTDESGAQWGVGYPAGEFDKMGWVPLADMACIYDYRDFEEDHGAEFRDYDGSGDELEEALVFTYPGGTVSSTLTRGGGDTSFSFRSLYTDENGLRWTFIGYYMGHRDGWVCIDDPMNETLGAAEARTVSQVRGEGETLVHPAASIPAARSFPLWTVPVALVIVAVVVTAVILRVRRKRN